MKSSEMHATGVSFRDILRTAFRERKKDGVVSAAKDICWVENFGSATRVVGSRKVVPVLKVSLL